MESAYVWYLQYSDNICVVADNIEAARKIACDMINTYECHNAAAYCHIINSNDPDRCERAFMFSTCETYYG